MGSISEWLSTHNSLVIMPKIPWFYIQVRQATNHSRHRTESHRSLRHKHGQNLCSPRYWMSSLFVESALPRLVQTSPPLSAPLQEAQMRTARSRNKYQSQSERRPGESNLGFYFKHQVMLSWQRVQQVMQRGRMLVKSWGFGSTYDEKNKNRSEYDDFRKNIPDSYTSGLQGKNTF